MFCPKCGSILKFKKSGKSIVQYCSCGYKSKDVQKSKLSEKVDKNNEVAVVEEDFETDPITEAECKKCGHRKAYFWTVQTRASDEPETKFLKCEKCKHIWRDYS